MAKFEGQITVFSIIGCPHCLAMKQTLRDHQLEFVDVSVEKYPNIRQWLRDRVQRTSVPQLFFNDVHIGGNDALQNALKKAEKWEEYLSILKNPMPSNTIPIPDVLEIEDLNPAEFTCLHDPKKDIVNAFSKTDIPREYKSGIFSKKIPGVFSGESFVQWYMGSHRVDQEEALIIGKDILSKNYILPLEANSFSENIIPKADVYYRLNESSYGDALNAGPRQDCWNEDAGKVSVTLRNLILQVHSEFLSADGKGVDYDGMRHSAKFLKFVEFSRELQATAINSLVEKKSFFINIYNAMVIHANVIYGPPSGLLSRLRFFSKVKYVIGGFTFSLNDIENGILRANAKGIASFCHSFKNDDPRIHFALDKVDPRIHFALNCGAKSCPPIKTFSAENIEEELQLATESYLEEEGIMIKLGNGSMPEIHLTKLMKWYKVDFIGVNQSEEKLIDWIRENLSFISGDLKEKFEEVLNKPYKIHYLTYDWQSNKKK